MKHLSAFLSVAALLAAALLAGCSGESNPITSSSPTLDTTPPPAPTGVAVGMEPSLNRPTVSWQPSAAADVAGYDIYVFDPDPTRDNAYVKVNTSLVTGAEFPLAPVAENVTVHYRVKAVDLAGNASAASATATGNLTPGTFGGGDGGGGGGGGRDNVGD